MGEAHKFIRNQYKGIFHMAIESNGEYIAACGTKFTPYSSVVVEDEMPFYGFRCSKCFPGIDRITLEVSSTAVFALQRSADHRLYAEMLVESVAKMPWEQVAKHLDEILGASND